MLEDLMYIEDRLATVALRGPLDLGAEATTALLEAQLRLRRVLRQPAPKNAPTGILRAITETLAEVEELRNAVPVYTVSNHLGVSEGFHLGEHAAYARVLARLEGIYAAYDQPS